MPSSYAITSPDGRFGNEGSVHFKFVAVFIVEGASRLRQLASMVGP
jgi:hypothetical protein